MFKTKLYTARNDFSCLAYEHSSNTGATSYIVGLRRHNGFVLIESKGVMVGEVGACDGGGLGVDLGVQALELARMTLEGARV